MNSDEFLDRFFSPPNNIRLADPQSSSVSKQQAALQPWINLLRQPEPVATVLPFQRDNREIVLYGVAGSEREFRRLRELLMAFIGPSYSDYSGEPAALDADDPIESAVADFTGGKALRFSTTPELKRDVWESLELMRHVLDRKPKIDKAECVPRNRLLRDFFMALSNYSRATAQETLERLRAGGMLDAKNQLFLTVQLLETFEDWSQLLKLRELSDLLRMRRPLSVTHALIRAVYQQELSTLEQENDFEGAQQHFGESVIAEYASLFATHGGLLRSRDAVKAFALFAVFQAEPSESLRLSLREAAESLGDSDAFLEYLVSRLPKAEPLTTPADPLEYARQTLLAGNVDGAFAAARDAPHSPERARLLLQTALELQSLEARAQAADAVSELADDEREALVASQLFRLVLGAPEEAAVGSVPTDWISWLDSLNSKGEWPKALETARDGSYEWAVTPILSDLESADRLEQLLLGTRDSEAEQTLQWALPHFLDWLQRDEKWPRPEARKVYRTALELLAFGTEGNANDLAVYHELLAGLLQIGMPEQDYDDLVQLSFDLWTKISSPQHVDWLLDVLDEFVFSPCANPEARLRLASQTVTDIQRFWRRSSVVQLLLLKQLCEEGDYADLKSAAEEILGRRQKEEEVEASPTFAEQVVGIYTLSVSAGERARSLLAQQFPGLDVRLNSDHRCTDPLRDLARNADLLVVVARSAKHAATDCIGKHRRSDQRVLFPTGKGSSSIMSAVTSYMLEEAATAA